MDDQDIAPRLLAYLANKFNSPGLAYAEGPSRISGGYDAAIFGFALKDAPAPLDGPLILRLNRPRVSAEQIKLEATVHNWLAGQGYAIPDVRVGEIDATLLGGRFTVMTRLAGKPLAHEVERVLGGSSVVAKIRGFARLPAISSDITEAWVDAQIKLHALDPAALLAAVRAAGLDPAMITFDGQLSRLTGSVEQFSFDGLKPAVEWLRVQRPSASLRDTVCHGDFHPMNILGDHGKVSGVIDWGNVVVAPAEMDVGSALANIGTVPFDVPAVLSIPLQIILARVLRRYRESYAARRPLDDAAVRYFQTFRCLAQLVPVLIARMNGATAAGAFGSDRGIDRLTRHIWAVSGVTVKT